MTEQGAPDPGPRKKRWADLTPVQRAAIVATGTVEVALTIVAVRDLVRRPAGQVRGPKVLWVVGCFVQPIGPIAYLLGGRSRPRRATARIVELVDPR